MARVGYRELKKILNAYHKFSFNMPRKGKDFTPQQKASITRTFNKYKDLINSNRRDNNTFIPFPKGDRLRDVDGVRTNKGLFYKVPHATLTKTRTKTGRVKHLVKVEFKKVRELFLPFPDFIKIDLELIKDWVDAKAQKLKPDYIMWSVNGHRATSRYDPDLFNLYITSMDSATDLPERLEEKATLAGDAFYGAQEKGQTIYNGVWFGWLPGNKRRIRKTDL